MDVHSRMPLRHTLSPSFTILGVGGGGMAGGEGVLHAPHTLMLPVPREFRGENLEILRRILRHNIANSAAILHNIQHSAEILQKFCSNYEGQRWHKKHLKQGIRGCVWVHRVYKKLKNNMSVLNEEKGNHKPIKC